MFPADFRFKSKKDFFITALPYFFDHGIFGYNGMTAIVPKTKSKTTILQSGFNKKISAMRIKYPGIIDPGKMNLCRSPEIKEFKYQESGAHFGIKITLQIKMLFWELLIHREISHGQNAQLH